MAAKKPPLKFRHLKKMVLKIPAEPEKIKKRLLEKGWKEGKGKLSISVAIPSGGKMIMTMEGNVLSISPAKGKTIVIDEMFMSVMEGLMSFSLGVSGKTPRPREMLLLAEGEKEFVRRRLHRDFPDGKIPLFGWACPWELRSAPQGMELFLGKGRKTDENEDDE